MTARLETGSVAPAFTLLDQNENPVSLSDYAGKKVILYFYPAAMTPGCTKQACDFSESLESLTAHGYVVLGISKDAPAKLKKFEGKDHITFPLLSDVSLDVHNAYAAYGEKSMYGKTVQGVIRSTFVIDEAGKISLALYNVRATGHVASLKEKLGL